VISGVLRGAEGHNDEIIARGANFDFHLAGFNPCIYKTILIYMAYIIYDGNVVDKINEVVRLMKVLANPIRLEMLSSLYAGPKHVYALAKEMGLSYPLALLYLRSLEEAGLVESVENKLEGEREKRVYRVKPFKLEITPEFINSLFNSPAPRANEGAKNEQV